MRLTAPAESFSKVISLAWLAAIGLVLAGCSTVKTEPQTPVEDVVEITRFWQPQLLSILRQPYSRLYVEVDAVKGCEPSQAVLDKLKQFLGTYCDKPDGIEIVRSDVIPVKDARGISRKALARKYLNGPPLSGKQQPAYLYLLFFDGKWCDQQPADRTAATVNRTFSEKDIHPHVDFLPYPAAAYINTRYGTQWIRDKYIREPVLIHEAGHLLGLAGRTNEAKMFHCENPGCLMRANVVIRLSKMLTFRDPVEQKSLCETCRQQLTNNARQSPPANLRFVGPVLVRTEPTYHVLSLLNWVCLVAGDLTDQDCLDFAKEALGQKPIPGVEGNDLTWQVFIKDDIGQQPEIAAEILTQAKSDPYSVIRDAAGVMLEKLAGSQ